MLRGFFKEIMFRDQLAKLTIQEPRSVDVLSVIQGFFKWKMFRDQLATLTLK